MHTMKLRDDALDPEHLSALGFTSLTALARYAGVAPTTVRRAKRGGNVGGLLAGALVIATGETYDRLFTTASDLP